MVEIPLEQEAWVEERNWTVWRGRELERCEGAQVEERGKILSV